MCHWRRQSCRTSRAGRIGHRSALKSLEQVISGSSFHVRKGHSSGWQDPPPRRSMTGTLRQSLRAARAPSATCQHIQALGRKINALTRWESRAFINAYHFGGHASPTGGLAPKSSGASRHAGLGVSFSRISGVSSRHGRPDRTLRSRSNVLRSKRRWFSTKTTWPYRLHVKRSWIVRIPGVGMARWSHSLSPIMFTGGIGRP